MNVSAYKWAAIAELVVSYLATWLEKGEAETLPPAFHGRARLVLLAMEQGAVAPPKGSSVPRVCRQNVQDMYLPGLLLLPPADAVTAESAARTFRGYRECLENLQNGKGISSVSRESLVAAHAFFERLSAQVKKSRANMFAYEESPLLHRGDEDD